MLVNMKNKASMSNSGSDDLNIGNTVKVQARDLNVEGQGVAVIIGETGEEKRSKTIFVPGLLPEEKALIKIVTVKKNYAVGKIIKLLEAGPYRVEEKCPVARKCGGCNLQNLDYRQQLNIKQQQVENCLLRIGKIEPAYLKKAMRPILGMEQNNRQPFAYRNKIQMRFAEADGSGEMIYGYYAANSHRIINGEDCCLQPPLVTAILKKIKEFCLASKIKAYDELTGQGYLRHVMIRTGTATRQLMVVLVVNAKNRPLAENTLINLLKKVAADFSYELTSLQLNYNLQRTNLILGAENVLLYGRDYIEEIICGLKYRISPHSFFQVNSKQTEILYENVLAAADLQADDSVFDLYCGTGSISLLLAKKAKEVVGIEIVDSAIKDAEINAGVNGLADKCKFYCGKAEEVAPALVNEGCRPNVIVLDPPRKGCDRLLLTTVLQVLPEKIVYVSCSPASLARDLAVLLDSGSFHLVSVQPVDMFPMTTHVECIALIQRVKS